MHAAHCFARTGCPELLLEQYHNLTAYRKSNMKILTTLKSYCSGMFLAWISVKLAGVKLRLGRITRKIYWSPFGFIQSLGVYFQSKPIFDDCEQVSPHILGTTSSKPDFLCYWRGLMDFLQLWQNNSSLDIVSTMVNADFEDTQASLLPVVSNPAIWYLACFMLDWLHFGILI